MKTQNNSEQKTTKRVFNLIIVDESGSMCVIEREGMAGSMAIDNHLSFCEDEESTRAMFRRESRSRERFNMFCASKMEMPCGSYFEEDEN